MSKGKTKIEMLLFQRGLKSVYHKYGILFQNSVHNYLIKFIYIVIYENKIKYL